MKNILLMLSLFYSISIGAMEHVTHRLSNRVTLQTLKSNATMQFKVAENSELHEAQQRYICLLNRKKQQEQNKQMKKSPEVIQVSHNITIYPAQQSSTVRFSHDAKSEFDQARKKYLTLLRARIQRERIKQREKTKPLIAHKDSYQQHLDDMDAETRAYATGAKKFKKEKKETHSYWSNLSWLVPQGYYYKLIK